MKAQRLRTFLQLSAALGFLVLVAGTGVAHPADWEFSVAAYGWGAEVDDVDEHCPSPCTSFSTDPVDYGETLNPLNGGYLSRIRASNGRWRLFAAAARSSGTGPHQYDDIAMELDTLELGAEYGLSPKFALLFGARYGEGHMDWARPFMRGIVYTGRSRYEYVEPFIGGAWSLSAAEHWTFAANADVGGFGIGSRLSWRAEAEVRYLPTERLALALGYRVIEVEVMQKSWWSDDFFLEFGFPGVLAGVVVEF